MFILYTDGRLRKFSFPSKENNANNIPNAELVKLQSLNIGNRSINLDTPHPALS